MWKISHGKLRNLEKFAVEKWSLIMAVSRIHPILPLKIYCRSGPYKVRRYLIIILQTQVASKYFFMCMHSLQVEVAAIMSNVTIAFFESKRY